MIGGRQELGKAGALDGLRVIDVATLLAGPLVATNLGDFGAEVIKIEHPRGDALRTFGWSTDGTSVYWKTGSRNKLAATLNLKAPEGQDLMRELVAGADVLIENFRPGTMERWGLGYEELSAVKPGLVMVRTTGFGQDGPYSGMPGFGTLAEAMSGLASVLGDRDRPPIVPPLPMADAVASLYGTWATLAALYNRDARGGTGQWIDVNLLESMVAFMAPQISAYEALGVIPERDGSQAPFSAPRGVYQTSDGGWIALSTSAQSVANRLFAAIGRADLLDDPDLQTNTGRLEHRDRIDGLVQEWARGRTLEEALRELRASDVAVAPVYTAKDVVEDEHLNEREAVIQVPDADLGSIKMHGVVPRMSSTPGEVREAGRPLGADNHRVYVDMLGHSVEQVEAWRRDQVI
jgi:formyl-CoA transferase